MSSIPSNGNPMPEATLSSSAAGVGLKPQCFQKYGPDSQQEQQADDVKGTHDAGDADQQQQQEGAVDYVTSTLRQGLVADVEAFFQSEVAPRSAAIAEDMAALQYEADLLSSKANAEKLAVLMELDRLHKLVASFQAQIMNVFQ